MKMFKRVLAAGAAMMMAVTGMTMGASADWSDKYSTSNYYSYITLSNYYSYSYRKATHTGRVDVWNYCSEINYASNVTTIAQAYCSAPQGTNYYNVKTIVNDEVELVTDYGTFPYVNVNNALRNYVKLTYNSSSYYYQEAEGETASY